MIINDLDGYYIVFDTKNWNTELDTLPNNSRSLFKANLPFFTSFNAPRMAAKPFTESPSI